jgi:hypothetical protein
MKEGIKNAIEDIGVGRDLSERDKGMIEAGYMQRMMQEAQDMGIVTVWYPESVRPNSDREVIVELDNGFTIIATWMRGFGYWMSVNGEVKGAHYWCEKPERKNNAGDK